MYYYYSYYNNYNQNYNNYNQKPEYYEIGETYLKFDFEFNEQNKAIIKKTFSKYYMVISKELLEYSDFVKVSIEFDKGSLKTRIRIWGLVATIYIGVGQYGSFRQGVKQIIVDVKNFSEYVINNFEKEPQIGTKRIIRYEKRTALTGRIYDIYRSIDKLEKRLNTLSQYEIKTELRSIKQRISDILTLLPEDTRQHFLKELPENYKNNLPEPNERKVNYLINRYALKPDEEIEFIEK